MLKRIRTTKAARRESILTAAVHLAVKKGYKNFSARDLSELAKCTHALVFHHFESMDHLRDEVMLFAVNRENAELVLQGLTSGHPAAANASKELKEKAKKLLNFES